MIISDILKSWKFLSVFENWEITSQYKSLAGEIGYKFDNNKTKKFPKLYTFLLFVLLFSIIKEQVVTLTIIFFFVFVKVYALGLYIYAIKKLTALKDSVININKLMMHYVIYLTFMGITLVENNNYIFCNKCSSKYIKKSY